MTLDVIEVLTETDLYNFDFSKLLTFFDKADVVKKLNGYVQHNLPEGQKHNTRSILYQVRDFIHILSFNPKDGKFILKTDSLEYICLNPALTLKRLID